MKSEIYHSHINIYYGLPIPAPLLEQLGWVENDRITVELVSDALILTK